LVDWGYWGARSKPYFGIPKSVTGKHPQAGQVRQFAGRVVDQLVRAMRDLRDDVCYYNQRFTKYWQVLATMDLGPFPT